MENNSNNNPLTEIRLKLLILGDSAVGKTSMLLKYTDNFFPESHLATIGIEFKTKEIKFNDYLVHLKIWDTAGQERFRAITKSYFRGSNGVIFMYDITKKETFKNVKDWIKDSENNNFGFEKILVGNKIDLEQIREVELKDVEEWAGQKNINVLEISAKNGTNVEKCFNELIRLILENKSKQEILEKFGMNSQKEENTLNKGNNNFKDKKKKCC
jgi:small GTP-binding protein